MKNLYSVIVTNEEKDLMLACVKTIFNTSEKVNPELSLELELCIKAIEQSKQIL